MYAILHDALSDWRAHNFSASFFAQGWRQVGHAILLGDSIFDNAAYVRPGDPDVVRQLQEQLPHDWQATLLAVDGSVIRSVRSQLKRLPAAASHLILSLGGTARLGHARPAGRPRRP